MTIPKITYGLIFHPFPDYVNEPIQWFDSMKDVKEAQQVRGNIDCTIKVYALSQCLTSIRYAAHGAIQGYHYFGIHPDSIEMATQYGITSNVILDKE